jgi:hypothetical protein
MSLSVHTIKSFLGLTVTFRNICVTVLKPFRALALEGSYLIGMGKAQLSVT